MKKVILSTLGSAIMPALLLSLGLASPAVYAGGGGKHGLPYDFNKDGELTRADAEGAAAERFEHLDRNTDGVVNAEDLEGNGHRRAKWRAKIADMQALTDTNLDGDISQQELTNYAVARFEVFDGDFNGVISDEEMSNAREIMRTERQKEMFRLLDANRDGQVSEEEFIAYTDRRSSRHGHYGHHRR